MVCGTATPASPGNWLEIQILSPHQPRFPESGTLEMGPSNKPSLSPIRDSSVHWFKILHENTVKNRAKHQVVITVLYYKIMFAVHQWYTVKLQSGVFHKLACVGPVF